MFLYKFAEVNQKAADQFYEQALAVYGDKPLREFLYLAAYPFAIDTPGDMPFTGSYSVPRNFVLNDSLQRLFIQTLLRRAQQALQVPLDEGDNFNSFPGTAHILEVLTQIEPHVQIRYADLAAGVEEARNNMLATLSPEAQSLFLKPRDNHDSMPKRSFDERVEAAEKESNVGRRNELLVRRS